MFKAQPYEFATKWVPRNENNGMSATMMWFPIGLLWKDTQNCNFHLCRSISWLSPFWYQWSIEDNDFFFLVQCILNKLIVLERLCASCGAVNRVKKGYALNILKFLFECQFCGMEYNESYNLYYDYILWISVITLDFSDFSQRRRKTLSVIWVAKTLATMARRYLCRCTHKLKFLNS